MVKNWKQKWKMWLKCREQSGQRWGGEAGRAQVLGAFVSHGARCEGKLLLEQERERTITLPALHRRDHGEVQCRKEAIRGYCRR